MNPSWMSVLIAGIFGISGVLGGALRTGALNHRLEQRKRTAEDQRRWLADQRQLYARYLTMCDAMLREIDGIAVFLSYDGSEPIKAEDEELISDGLLDYNSKWDDELQPLLE